MKFNGAFFNMVYKRNCIYTESQFVQELAFFPTCYIVPIGIDSLNIISNDLISHCVERDFLA